MTRAQVVAVVSAVALFLAVLASWGVYSYLKRETQKHARLAGKAVVVAATEVPVGSRLGPSQMKIVKLAADSLAPGSHSDTGSLTGRTVIRHLSVGDQITEPKLMSQDGRQTSGVMAYRVPKGHRAVTVGVNEVAGVAGFLAPQDRVDVVLTTAIPGKGSGETVSKIVLQDVPVLATGQTSEHKEGKPVVAPTVTLDLAPDDATTLVHAAHKGKLQLLLRNIVDTAQVSAPGTTIAKVLGGATVAVPTPARKALHKPKQPKPQPEPQPEPQPPKASVPKVHVVELIKGKERSTATFTE